jgi:hypothetical protein
MSVQQKLTVTIHWRDEQGTAQTLQIACPDRPPERLIQQMVGKLGLPALGADGEELAYELRLDGEQRPPLRLWDPLSSQEVRDGSRLWLTTSSVRGPRPVLRCLLQLPDGSEIVVPSRGHGMTRTWLLAFIQLQNPEEYQREVERFKLRQSAYRYVSDQSPHCRLSIAERGYWVVTTDRDDVLTEWAGDGEFDRVPIDIPQRLDNGMRLRLGGRYGLEIGLTIV